MKFRTLIAAAALTLSFAACGKSKIDKMISQESDWKDKMCACTDKDCTEKTWKDYKTWDDESKKDFSEDDIKNVSGDTIEKAMKIEEDMRTCRHKYDK